MIVDNFKYLDLLFEALSLDHCTQYEFTILTLYRISRGGLGTYKKATLELRPKDELLEFDNTLKRLICIL